MKKFIALFGAIALVMFGLIAPAANSAPLPKVDVCHMDGQGDYDLININENAYPAHVEHGDLNPGDAIPSMPGYQFGADCAPELAAAPEVQFTMNTYCDDTDQNPVVSWAYNLTAALVPAYTSYTVEVSGIEYTTSWTPTGPQPGDVVHTIGRGIANQNTAGLSVPAIVTITDPLGVVTSYSVIVPTGPQSEALGADPTTGLCPTPSVPTP